MAYPTKKLAEILDRVSKSAGILTKNYLSDGEYPIVDQGQSRIAGYTNDSTRIYRGGLPVVIFGDHTRSLKFIDFPFAVGADGTKILKPISGIDAKYLYYFLQSVELPARGYARHFSLLKTAGIPVPPVVEQKRIVAKIEKQFAKIDEAARLRAESESLTAQILPSALHEIFSSAESKGWKMGAVGDLCEIKGGKRLPKGHAFVTGPTKHPYIRVADFIPYGIDQSGLKYISDETFKSSSRYTISKSDVFISIAGTIGSAGIIPENLDGANLTENAAKLTNLKGVDQRYLMYILTSIDAKQQMTGDMIQTTIAKLGLFRIARLRIPLPPIAEQKKIVKKLDALSEKVRALRELQSSQSADLKSLKQSILHGAFSDA